jgi:ADP-heptose:LPS heptosyltransferase
MNVLLLVDGGPVEVLQASPLLRSLVAGLDAASVTVACAPLAAPVAAQIPGVAEAVALPALAPGGATPGNVLRAWTALRKRRFHAAAVCAEHPVGALLAYFTGIPRRAGLADGVVSLLLTDRVEREGDENRAATWLRLASALGVEQKLHQPSYNPGVPARLAAEQRMLASGFEDGRLMVALAPGSGFADPMPAVAPRALAWDPERFAHLCNQLTRRHGAGIVVLGTAGDRGGVDAMMLDVESTVLDLCAELETLADVAAVLERCDLLVCGDSPLLHLAAAVGTPSVGLFGPTSGRMRAPYGEGHRVVQAMQASTSLRGIRVDDVLAGIEAEGRVS